MLPSLANLNHQTTEREYANSPIGATLNGKRKASTFSFLRANGQLPSEELVQLQKLADADGVSYATALADAFDAYAAIVLCAKTMSWFVVRVNREVRDATRLYQDEVGRRGGLWTDSLRQVIQDALDRQDLEAWSGPLGYEQAHHWMATLLLFLNSEELPKVTAELERYMRMPKNDGERRALIEDLLKYDGSVNDAPSMPRLDRKLLHALVENRARIFDVALRKRLASHLDHLVDDGVRMFGVTLGAPATLFRADDRPAGYEITDISVELQKLSATVVSSSTEREIDALFCDSSQTASPCVVYEFRVAAGTTVLPVTADHPFLETPLVHRKFYPHTFEQEVVLPKGMTYELQSATPTTGRTRSGRSTTLYTVNVHS